MPTAHQISGSWTGSRARTRAVYAAERPLRSSAISTFAGKTATNSAAVSQPASRLVDGTTSPAAQPSSARPLA